MQVQDSESGRSYYSKRRRRLDGARTARALTFSCFRRYPFFAKDRTRVWFVEALEEARSQYPIDLWAWVLMPDHVHLLVRPRQPGTAIGRFQGLVKERVARRAIGWIEQHAPEWLPRITVTEGGNSRRRFWQPGGGYDRNVAEDGTLLATIEYLHQNPVRRQLVPRSVDWEWSSARWYAGEADCRLAMDKTVPTICE